MLILGYPGGCDTKNSHESIAGRQNVEMLPTGFKEQREPCTKGSEHAQSWKGKEANFSLQSLEEYCPNDVLVPALWDLIWTSDLQNYIVNLGFSPCSCQ